MAKRKRKNRFAINFFKSLSKKTPFGPAGIIAGLGKKIGKHLAKKSNLQKAVSVEVGKQFPSGLSNSAANMEIRKQIRDDILARNKK